MYSKSAFLFLTPSTMDNILAEKNLFGKKHFLTKNLNFLEFSKSLLIHHIDYENISAVKCTSGREPMTKLEVHVAGSHNCKC